MGHCEIDRCADRSYRALFDTEGEWHCEDIRTVKLEELPEFDLLCGGFPCQSFSDAGNAEDLLIQGGRCSLNYPAWLKPESLGICCLKMFPDCFTMTKGGTFAEILHALDRLGYFVEWQVLNSKDFHVPQSRKRVYLVGYLDVRCRGKIFPFTETAETPLIQIRPGKQGERVYSPEGVSCTLTAQAGGMGGKTGLYEVGLPIREDTRKGYKMAFPGDSVNLAYAKNNRRGRVGRQIAHTLTACNDQGTVEAGAVLTPDRETIQHSVLQHGRIRRLTPRECLRLQGWADDRIDLVMPLHSDTQLYKQTGNGVTVNVVEAIGKRLAAAHAVAARQEVTAID